MAGYNDRRNAENAFKAFCDMLDDRQWNYDKDDEKLVIESGATGDDLAIEFRVTFSEEKQLVTILSRLPFTVPEDKKVLVAVALAATNYPLVNGNFDFGLNTGSIIFRATTSFRDSLIGKDAYEYLLGIVLKTVDEYNDKLLALIKNTITLEDYLNLVKE